MKMFSKKTKVKSLRNVLSSPFHLQWSEKRDEEISPIQSALEELLPAAKLIKKPLNRQIKKNKDEIEQKYVDVTKKEQNIYRTYLAPGFQSVIRGLDKKELCCIILSREVRPISLQKVVFAYAYTHDVPILVIPDLKNITQSALGFPTMVLGFKNIVSEDIENKFYKIYRMVSENSHTVESPFILQLREDIISKESKEKSFDEPTKSPEIKSEHLYLYRQSTSDRVFIPDNKTGFDHEERLKYKKQKLDDFISLEKVSEKNTPAKKEVICKQFSDNDNDEEDDTDSCDDNLFFVDNKPDESLLLTKKLKSDKNKQTQSPNSMRKNRKKSTNINSPVGLSQTTYMKFKNDLQTEVNQLKNIKISNQTHNRSTVLLSSKNTSVSENEHSSYKMASTRKKHKKAKTQLSSSVKFRPLIIKAVTNNPQRMRTNKKKNKK